jgi:hypothetical protein
MYSPEDIGAVDEMAWAVLKSVRPTNLGGSERMPAAGEVAASYRSHLEAANRPQVVLGGSTLRTKDYLAAARKWAALLIVTYLGEVRAIICGPGKSGGAKSGSRVTVTATVSGLAAWIAGQFSLDQPVSIALAAVVIHTIGAPGIRSFCSATEREVLEDIARQYELNRDP